VTLGAILLIVLVLMLVGAFPRWSHSRNWGYAPSSGLGGRRLRTAFDGTDLTPSRARTFTRARCVKST
jgi:Protein of unknown function (DUF3309)